MIEKRKIKNLRYAREDFEFLFISRLSVLGNFFISSNNGLFTEDVMRKSRFSIFLSQIYIVDATRRLYRVCMNRCNPLFQYFVLHTEPMVKAINKLDDQSIKVKVIVRLSMWVETKSIIRPRCIYCDRPTVLCKICKFGSDFVDFRTLH